MTSQTIGQSVHPTDLTCNWRGYDTQYTVKGCGVPLVLIHGFGVSIGHWLKNIPVLAKAVIKFMPSIYSECTHHRATHL